MMLTSFPGLESTLLFLDNEKMPFVIAVVAVLETELRSLNMDKNYTIEPQPLSLILVV